MQLTSKSEIKNKKQYNIKKVRKKKNLWLIYLRPMGKLQNAQNNLKL